MSISRSGWTEAWVLGLALVGCGKTTAEPSCCAPARGGALAASRGFAAGTGGSGAIAGGGTTSGLDPMQTPDGLCRKWAENACNATVVTNCGAVNAAACVARQKQFCLGLLASKGLDGPFVLAEAEACLDAVKAACSTAALTAAAEATVLNLGFPCDTLEQAGTDAGWRPRRRCVQDRWSDLHWRR